MEEIKCQTIPKSPNSLIYSKGAGFPYLVF